MSTHCDENRSRGSASNVLASPPKADFEGCRPRHQEQEPHQSSQAAGDLSYLGRGLTPDAPHALHWRASVKLRDHRFEKARVRLDSPIRHVCGIANDVTCRTDACAGLKNLHAGSANNCSTRHIISHIARAVRVACEAGDAEVRPCAGTCRLN